MLNKYDTFLKQMLKQAKTQESQEYWAKEYIMFEQHLEDLELRTAAQFYPHKDFNSHLKSIFATGDSIQDVIAYCYDELPIINHKQITYGSNPISNCPLNATVTVDYDTFQITVEDEPILVNGYSLFTLTTGVF